MQLVRKPNFVSITAIIMILSKITDHWWQGEGESEMCVGLFSKQSYCALFRSTAHALSRTFRQLVVLPPAVFNLTAQPGSVFRSTEFSIIIWT